MIQRRDLARWALALTAAASLGGPLLAWAAEEGPEELVKRLSTDVLAKVRADKSLQRGDIDKVVALVDQTILPHVDFRRMTAAATGPAWRQATPDQQKRLQDEFKTLLIRTYSGALNQVSDQTITVKPVRMSPGDTDVLVRTEIKGRGDPVQLDYRLEKGAGGEWKVYNLNVMGVWLVDTYRSQFAQEINSKGIDGLIDALAARNKANAGKAS